MESVRTEATPKVTVTYSCGGLFTILFSTLKIIKIIN